MPNQKQVRFLEINHTTGKYPTTGKSTNGTKTKDPELKKINQQMRENMKNNPNPFDPLLNTNTNPNLNEKRIVASIGAGKLKEVMEKIGKEEVLKSYWQALNLKQKQVVLTSLSKEILNTKITILQNANELKRAINGASEKKLDDLKNRLELKLNRAQEKTENRNNHHIPAKQNETTTVSKIEPRNVKREDFNKILTKPLFDKKESLPKINGNSANKDANEALHNLFKKHYLPKFDPEGLKELYPAKITSRRVKKINLPPIKGYKGYETEPSQIKDFNKRVEIDPEKIKRLNKRHERIKRREEKRTEGRKEGLNR